MHPYVTDSDERTRILFWLAVISVVVTWGLHELLKIMQISIHWIIEAPSVMGFYFLFFNLNILVNII